jgi:rod shape-determining protein MreC
MNQRRRARALFIALIVTALVLVTFDFRGENGSTNSARNTATTGLAPFERSIATILGPVRRLNDNVRDLAQTRAENQRLRAEIEELRERRRAFADLEREAAELRALIGLRDTFDLEVVAGRVIAISPSNFEWTLTIDVGTQDGIERGMAVISANGLVGRVLQTTANASRVLLVIDPNFSVAARSLSTGSLGVVDGRGSEPLRFSPLDARTLLSEDDELVTATFAGSAIPAGIPIGIIGRLEESSSRLRSTYTVRPFVDVSILDRVLVILDAPAATVPPFTGSDGIVFERPPVGPIRTDPSSPETDEPDAVGPDPAGGQ